MADYSKWKVTDLKAELKRRGIPQTGLRVKQNFIDRLLEEDAKGESEPVSEAPVDAQDTPQEDAQPVEPQQEAPEPTANDTTESHDPKPEEPPQEQVQPEEAQQQNGEPPAEDKAPEELPAADRTAEQPPQAPEAPEAQAPQEDEREASAHPVEQAPGSTDAQQPAAEEETQQPKATEAVASAVPQISEANTGLSTPLAPEEVLEDRRKRKRRSQSPIPTPEALAHKKAKAENEEPKVTLPEDKDSMDVDEGAQPDGDVPAQEAADKSGDAEPEHKPSPVQNEAQGEKPNESVPEETTKKDAPAKQDVRFKGLFAAPEPEPRAASPPPEDAMDDDTVEPAKHAATSALYVDGLMRPLQPNALKSHLLTLASPPGGSQDPDMITDFYLDSIKTHCFVSFVSVSAASRVRAALHNTVWPNERNRKTLFVDFIPENKLQEWIDLEEGSRRRGGPPPRWEVKYDRTEDGVEAVLEEIDPRSAAPQAPRGREPAEFSRPPPTGPRAEMGDPSRRPSGHSEADSKPRPGQGFKPLDDLFMSTTTKPKLYYLPVPRSVADRRLDRFDDLLRKGSFPRRGGDEPRRITFEDGDLFVDHGPDFNPRGGRGRGGRGRGRGRGFGDSWRDDRRGRYH
ncbi:SAP domain protein [Aspergillus melleus]|uniref:SAP domain protein n=1 Tax=Aspergillus melleus TaxID=138277 RepID=UPI001E8E4CC1|nr:uncharacterized protein LDX57_008150 [Aspergillus melleus]KAH8430488.1 hypothetical protein LDX57_008150 [Aspergillus melleus]